jgi:hypothetical protein
MLAGVSSLRAALAQGLERSQKSVLGEIAGCVGVLRPRERHDEDTTAEETRKFGLCGRITRPYAIRHAGGVDRANAVVSHHPARASSRPLSTPSTPRCAY